MTREEFEIKSFNELMEILDETRDDITTYEMLKEFAKQKIDEDKFWFAIHILESLQGDPAEWYQYDYTMGSMDRPCGLTCKDDIEHLYESFG